MKIALLSNINMDPAVRLLAKAENIEIYRTQGYGNELGVLLNDSSPLYGFGPAKIFLIIDTMELIGHELDRELASSKIMEWFRLFESSLKDHITYHVCDAYLYGPEWEVAADRYLKWDLENTWQQSLKQISARHGNVKIFGYRQIVCELGNRLAFSKKMWYMGKILHSTDFHRELAASIAHQAKIDHRVPKKVVALDLDNTLWGGLAGENNIAPIILSDDKTGLAYKNFQRVLKQMQRSGVLLCVVSKNNAEDALDIIRNHPHMVLKEDDFAVLKINWDNKRDNIVQLSRDLNLGLDSFVFIDDSPAERKLVSESLPEVAVPEFPMHPEELADFMVGIYHRYFEQSAITAEDLSKTRQYRANQERNQLLMKAVDFNSYLEGLDMRLIRVNPEKYMTRFQQLMNKTNQFNLTTRRFSSQEAAALAQNHSAEIFLYKVTDQFGDNGVVAAAIVEYGSEAVITEFTMSCRVMGRHIENAIIEDMERAARERGFGALTGIYVPSGKNGPVENLYPSAGYKIKKTGEKGAISYEIGLHPPIPRDYRLTREKEED